MFNMAKSRENLNTYYQNIKDNRRYLYPGVYRLFCKKKRYTWKREQSWIKWVLNQLFCSSMSLGYALKIILLSKKYIINDLDKNSCGDEIYITRKKQLKVFDHDRKQVHYFPFSSEIIERAELFNFMYAPFFEYQIIESINNDNNSITERFIVEDFRWRESEKHVMYNIKKIWIALIGYTESISDKKVVVTLSEFTDRIINECTDIELLTLIETVKEDIDGKVKYIPLIFQHNDLVLSNVLVEDGKISVFDYEFFDTNIFYYDAFMILMWQALHYKDDSYLLSYLQGKYDSFFKSIFRAVGIEYQSKLRSVYALLFIVSNIGVHIKTGDKTDLKKYKRVIELLKIHNMIGKIN